MGLARRRPQRARCALSLVVFFVFTFPANQQAQNWTVLPENRESLRRQWEYSDLTLSLVGGPD
jgi:hypothetical protein